MMQHAESFRDLIVYQKARKVAQRFFDLSKALWWARLTCSVVHPFAVFVKAQSSTSYTDHRLRITDHLSSNAAIIKNDLIRGLNYESNNILLLGF